MDFDGRAKFISLEGRRNEYRRTVDSRAKFISLEDWRNGFRQSREIYFA